MPTNYLVSLIAALLATALLMPIARRVAIRTDFVDHPNEAKFHRDPTPYMGGVALAVAVLLSLIAGVHFVPRLSVLVLTGTALATVGLVDDRRNLSAGLRLMAQVLAGIAVVGVGVVARVTGVPVIDAGLTIGWIVVVTNSFNLLDNMDGLAAGVGAASALGVGVLAAVHGQSVIGPLATAVVGACLGFLLYNWAPAAIFMGDAGSLFLGFLISVLAIGAHSSVTMPTGLVVTLLLVAVPLLDTTTVVMARVSHHRSIFVGGRDHLSHRLVTRGARPPLAVGLLVMTQLLLSTTAVALGSGRLDVVPAMLIGLLVVGMIAGLAAPARVYETTIVPRRLGAMAGAGSALAVGLIVLSIVAAAPEARSAGLSGPLESPPVLIAALVAGVGLMGAVAYLGFAKLSVEDATRPNDRGGDGSGR